MTTLPSMLARVRELEARKGVRVVPEEFKFQLGDWVWHIPGLDGTTDYIHSDAAARIFLGCLASFCGERGISVYVSMLPGKKEPCWVSREAGGNPVDLRMVDLVDPLTAYYETACRVLEEAMGDVGGATI